MSTGNVFDQILGQAADGRAKPVDNVIQSFEHFVSETQRAKLFPDLFYGVHLRGIGRDM